MRIIPVKLASRYEAEGWWTPDTIGDLLTRGLAAVVRCKAGHPMPTLDQVRAHFDRCGLARQKWPQELHAVDDFPRPASGKIQKFLLRRDIAWRQGREYYSLNQQWRISMLSRNVSHPRSDAENHLRAARGAHAIACDYAKVRRQYGRTIGSFQAVAHLLAEALALIEGSVSVLRHAAWAVDELTPAQAVQAARIAKVYCQRAARSICETAVQVHGGIGNTWECLVHVYLRRVLVSTEMFPVSLEEVARGFP